MAEVDSVRQDFKIFGKQLMEARLVDAVDGYWDLIKKSNNPMVSAKGYEFFIERSLGKLTNRIKLGEFRRLVFNISKVVLKLYCLQVYKKIYL